MEKNVGRILLMMVTALSAKLSAKCLNFSGIIIAAKNGEEALVLFRQAEEEGTPVSTAILDLSIGRDKRPGSCG